MKPVIGINCDYEEETKQPYSFTYRNYIDAVLAAQGIPLLLPMMKDKNDVELGLQRIDGLLLTGGNDVPPQRYGEERGEKTITVHADKDISDNLLVLIALQMKKPMLAICYGSQLVNVVLGGTLVQDIPSEAISPLVHKDSQNSRYCHPVTIEKNTLLYNLIRTDRIETNSVHHQAIKRLGKGLQVTAHTSDGIVEAIELEDYPFFLGVQWHPERMIDHPSHAALFHGLVRASQG